MKKLSIYVDLDGTLTDYEHRGGNPIISRIKRIKEFIAQGHNLVIWSSNQVDYVKEFCKTNNITGATMLGKPHLLFDDVPKIHPYLMDRVIKPSAIEHIDLDIYEQTYKR